MIMTLHIRGGAAVNNEEKILSILSVMQEKISAMEGSISAMQGDISTMQGTITSMQGTITAMQGDIASMKEDISQLNTPRRVSHPSQVCAVGDVVTVWVLDVDEKKKRISLTMKKPKDQTV